MKGSGNIPDDLDMKLMSFLQAGIPVEADPYREISEKLGLSRQEIVSRLKKLHVHFMLTSCSFGKLFSAKWDDGYNTQTSQSYRLTATKTEREK